MNNWRPITDLPAQSSTDAQHMCVVVWRDACMGDARIETCTLAELQDGFPGDYGVENAAWLSIMDAPGMREVVR